jgi:hypothetical protein
MTPPRLHVVGIDPGATTGWVLLTVPRYSIYGEEESHILEWDYGEFYGDEDIQVRELCRLLREIQSLDYLIGPAAIVEDFDIPPHAPTTNPELLSPVRIAAKLAFAARIGMAGDARIVLQGRTIAKGTVTDERLKRWGYWVEGSDHIRDAARHAITALRRARDNPEFRDEIWYDGTSKRPAPLLTARRV